MSNELTVKREHGIATMIGIVALPLAVSIVSSLLTSDAMRQFGMMSQPPLAPPAWLFPVAWTILYLLMGAASYRIYMTPALDANMARTRHTALVVYGIQLFFNFFWSIAFFNFHLYWFSLVWLLAMWAMIVALVVLAARVSRPAALMLVPYLAWTTFAAYLNLGIAILN